MIKLDAETERLNRALALYRDLTGKTPEEVLLKQGGKLGYALSQRLHDLAPGKGEVRTERLEALKSGEGVRVRKRVQQRIMAKHGARIDLKSRELVFGNSLKGRKSLIRKGGKRMNLRALMVEAELNIRESGRGFLARSARYPKILQRQQLAKSKYGPLLSQAGLSENLNTLTFEWDSSKSELSGSAAAGLGKDKAAEVIAGAMREVSDDIRGYLSQRLAENGRKAGLT